MSKLDLENTCRTCFQKGSALISLFQTEQKSDISFTSLLYELTSIKVTCDDRLPNKICQICAERLFQSYSFREQCININNKLLRCEQEHDNDNPIPHTPAYSDISISVKDIKEEDIELDECDDDDPYPLNENDELDVDCDKQYSNESNLNCTVCKKVFSRSADVRRHMVTHTGVKPFNCVVCSASFTQSGTLAQHMRKHEDFQDHLTKNTEKSKKIHLCSICGKSFKDSSSLTIHIRRHTGDKPYQCDVCSMSDNNDDETYTPPESLKVAKATPVDLNLLPEKSKKIYHQIYTVFMEWRNMNKIDSLSEDVLLTYFTKLSEKYKSSSLWKTYSILRSTLNIHNEVNIAYYPKLRAFLKRKSEGYEAKKSKTFTPEQINKFMVEAPDGTYLATKVALIMGLMGACRRIEMYSMKMEDIQDLKSTLLISVPNAKTKAVRQFAVTGSYYEICKRYALLRPATAKTRSFFLNYHRGKCTDHNIGINKFGSMGKQIASYLKLPNTHQYTVHSFRSSSATLLVGAGTDSTALNPFETFFLS